MRSNFDGDALQHACENTPKGPLRLAAYQQAIQKADVEGTPYWRIHFRYSYAWECVLRGDPPTALPVCAEFIALFEEYKDTCFIHGIMPLAICQIASELSFSLPQIPLSQCMKLLGQFWQYVHCYHLGARVGYWQACKLFYAMGNMDAVSKCYHRYQSTPTDDFSDCPACEVSHAAWFLLMIGQREQAEKVADAVLAGHLTCSDQPHEVYSNLLMDDLLHGRTESAVAFAQRLARICQRDKSDLEYLGNVICCFAFTNPERGIELLERGFAWSVGMWDQSILLGYYQGCWCLCTRLAAQGGTLSMNLPASFPLWQENGLYSATALADWFYDQAYTIAQRFDQRNGSSRCMDRIQHLTTLLTGTPAN